MDSIKNFADKTKQAVSSKLPKGKSSASTTANTEYDEENPFEEESSINPSSSPVSSYNNNNNHNSSSPAVPKAKTKSQSQTNIAPSKKQTVSTDKQPLNQNNINNNAAVAASSGTGLTASQLAARDKELKEREQKLMAMEKQLEKRSAEVEKLAGKMKNWPFKCYPILYHSIQDEIPQPMQSIVKKFYYFWQFMALCLVVNWLAVIIIWAQTGSMSIIDILLATFYIVAGIPGSWILWYSPFYKTMKAKSSVSWSFFIMGFTLHWLFTVCMGISVPWFAGAGIIVFIQVVVSGYAVSIIFNLVALGFWGINWIITGYLTKKARDEYKAAGQNLKSMKSGFVGEAIKMQLKS